MRYLRSTMLLLTLCAASSTLLGADGPLAAATYFRSDAGVGRSPGSLPENLETAEAQRWRVPLDAGHSTPILQGGKIFLTTYQPASRELATVALDETSGRVLWRQPVVPKQIEETHQI